MKPDHVGALLRSDSNTGQPLAELPPEELTTVLVDLLGNIGCTVEFVSQLNVSARRRFLGELLDVLDGGDTDNARSLVSIWRQSTRPWSADNELQTA